VAGPLRAHDETLCRERCAVGAGAADEVGGRVVQPQLGHGVGD
jgi:hypothetical protein